MRQRLDSTGLTQHGDKHNTTIPYCLYGGSGCNARDHGVQCKGLSKLTQRSLTHEQLSKLRPCSQRQKCSMEMLIIC
jgi:hypothetical protein